MKKILLWSLIWSMALWSVTFGESTQAVECMEQYMPVVSTTYAQFTKIYPSSLLKIAQQNHKNYCCKYHNDLTSSSVDTFCADNPTTTYVDSPWLFDHLIDVGFRYLDGLEDLQYDGADVDTKAKEWREKIIELASDPNGAVPLQILSDYTTYRWNRKTDLNIVQSQDVSCSDSLQRFARYNAERDSLPLTQKYYIICELSSCMASNQKNTFLTVCQAAAQKRVLQEDDYVQWVLVYQWQQSLNTTFNAYARSYMNHNKLNTLLEKIVTMAKWLWFVDSKVPEMTRMCSA